MRFGPRSDDSCIHASIAATSYLCGKCIAEKHSQQILIAAPQNVLSSQATVSTWLINSKADRRFSPDQELPRQPSLAVIGGCQELAIKEENAKESESVTPLSC